VWLDDAMLVLGGYSNEIDPTSPSGVKGELSDGARYDPLTNTWVDEPFPMGAPIPTPVLAVGRVGHSAIWTGVEMLTWGGRDSLEGRTGYGFDPVTNNWRRISRLGSPSARRDHSAVWTGTEMLVWGGFGPAGEIGNGGRYNPMSDAWEGFLSTDGAPATRNGHAAVWTGTEMLIFGGAGSGTQDTGGRYDPVLDEWTAISSVGAPSMENLDAVWTGEEMLIWGFEGTLVFPDSQMSGFRYDPIGNAWSAPISTENAPPYSNGHSAIWTGNAMVVWGGNSENLGGYYDPLSDAWVATTSTVGDPDEEVWGHTAVWTGDQMIVWGGQVGLNGEVLLYSPFIDLPKPAKIFSAGFESD